VSPSIDSPVVDGGLVSLRAVEPADWPAFADHEREHIATRLGTGWVPVPWSQERLRTWAAAPERSTPNSINTHQCVGTRRAEGVERTSGIDVVAQSVV